MSRRCDERVCDRGGGGVIRGYECPYLLCTDSLVEIGTRDPNPIHNHWTMMAVGLVLALTLDLVLTLVLTLALVLTLVLALALVLTLALALVHCTRYPVVHDTNN